MMPVISPGPMWRSIFFSTYSSADLLYPKLTPSKSTEPSFTSKTGSFGFTMSLFSFITSVTRWAEAKDMVSITKMSDSIISDISMLMQ